MFQIAHLLLDNVQETKDVSPNWPSFRIPEGRAVAAERLLGFTGKMGEPSEASMAL